MSTSETPPDTPHPVIIFVDSFQLEIVNQEQAMGQIEGVPVTLTILGNYPPKALFQFRVHPEGANLAPLEEKLAALPEDSASLDLGDGMQSSAWLTLYNLNEFELESFSE